jgi:tRNA A-37 threonylcarbamoyl transferase component Bud32
MNTPLSLKYCLDNNEDFKVYTKGGMQVLLRSKQTPPELENHLSELDDFFADARIVKDSRTTKAGLFDFVDKKYFLKRYNNKGLRYTLRNLFRKGRVFRAWKAAWILEQLNIPTPIPICGVEVRTVRILKSAYLITESLDALSTLELYELFEADSSRFINFLDTVIGYLVSMHKEGVYHGDLKLSNIYACKNSKSDYLFGLWDLDAVKIYDTEIDINLRIAELGRLVSSYVEIGRRLEIQKGIDDSIQQFAEKYEKQSEITIDREKLTESVHYYLLKTEKRKNRGA